MASIKYFITSKKEKPVILLRFRHTGIDLTKKTREFINIEWWDDKKKTIKKVRSLSKEDKTHLDKVKDNLEKLNRHILNKFSLRSDENIINGKWLEDEIEIFYNGGKKTINKDYLVNYTDYFIKRILPTFDISERTAGKYKLVIKYLLQFLEKENRNIKIQNFDEDCFYKFIDYLENDKLMNKTTVNRNIGVLKTILKKGVGRGFKINQSVFTLKLSDKRAKIEDNSSLREDEITKIYNYKTLDPEMVLTREWLLIGIFTGQRISDLYKFNKNNLIQDDNGHYSIKVYQYKTNHLVDIPVNKIILKILKKYNYDFPPKYNVKTLQSFERKLNPLLKKLLEKLNIDRVVTKCKRTKQGEKNIIGNFPIYEVYSSHDNRRTFATYFEGKLERSLIMQVTGHKKESSYLKYVGKIDVNKDKIRAVFDETFNTITQTANS